MNARVRLFAVAAETIGHTEVRTGADTVDRLLQELAETGGAGAAGVLQRCSILVNGHRSTGADPIPPGATVDVLPPFAGG